MLFVKVLSVIFCSTACVLSSEVVVDPPTKNASRFIAKAQGNADKLLEHLFDNCRYLRSSQRPVESASEAVQLEINLELIKFHGIDDTKQTMSVMAGIELYWTYPNCVKWDHMPQYNDIDVLYLPLSLPNKSGRLWTPKIFHTNNAEDVLILERYFDKIGQVFLHRNGNGYIFGYGIYTSTCDLGASLVKFPFDTQTCSLIFDPLWADSYVTITNGGFNPLTPLMGFAIVTGDTGSLSSIPSDFINDNNVWQLTGTNFSQVTKQAEFDASGSVGYSFTRVTYSLTFKRNPSQYIYDIFAPCWMLMLLQLGNFAEPPRFPERPVLSATIVLTFVVLHDSVAASIPTVSETLLIKVYILSQIVIGAVCTFYFIIASHYATMDMTCSSANSIQDFNDHIRAEYNSKKYGGLTLIRLVDVIVFLVALSITILVNAVVYSQMCS